MADNKTYVIELEVDGTGAIQSINKVNDGLAKTEKTAGDIKKSAEKSAGGFKAMGTAIKASGIGLLVAAFAFLKDVISSNQKVVDAFSAVLGTLSDMIRDAFSYIIDNGGKIVDYFKAIFNDPVQALKDFGQAIVDNVIERFNSFIDTLGFLAEGVKNLFSGDFSAALDSFNSAAKESVDVLTGVDDSVNKVTTAVSEGVDALVNYTKKTFDANMALVQLQNNAKLAAAQQARLAEQYDRQAEILRQQRDDENRSITDRMKSNDDLLEVLKKQEKAELAAASAQVAAAQATFEHSQTIDNQVALTSALANADGVRSKIVGLMTEQQMNQMALNREYNAMLKSQTESVTELNIASQRFSADAIKNDIERLNAQRAVLDAEKTLQLERLQSEVDKYNEGTQAKVDAQIAYNAKKQELDQALATNAVALSDAELARTNELAKLQIENSAMGMQGRLDALNLEYAEKEKLYKNDAVMLEEIEKEKQRKILILEQETKDAKLSLASDALGSIAALTEVFGQKSESAARKAFAIQKSVSIAQATIDTYKGANAIFASAAANPSTILFPAQPFIAAGIAIATGFANVAKIASQKFQGSTTPSTTTPPSTGSLGGGGGNNAPQGTSAPSFNALNLDFANNRPSQPVEAYVIAGDVANGIEARDKVRDLARLG